jgi:hypothetical protein
MSTNWIKLATVTFADLSAAATTKTLTFADGLHGPGSAKVEMENVRVNVTEKFIGGAINALTLEVGRSGDADRFVDAFDAFTAAVDVLGTQDADVLLPEVVARDLSITLLATATAANLSALTQGRAEVWVKIGALPA